MKRTGTGLVLACLAAAALLLVGTVAWLGLALDGSSDSPSGAGTSAGAGAGAGAAGRAGMIERGAYLVRIGSCGGCHTVSGSAAYAGGRAIETPFGSVNAPNLTPDAATGLGAWSSGDFWRALHNGRSRSGRLLYPAFPYPNYTRLTRADSDAMFAYLQTLAPVANANKPHALRFPFDLQASLAIWRALFFRPAHFEADAAKPSAWNRGAYLVETLGHCNACHSRRNAWGATAGPLDLAGGLIPIQNWYAPSLNDRAEASVADWSEREVVRLLRSGISATASVQGPMAEVVAGSTQYMSDDDLAAIAIYLRALPSTRSGAGEERKPQAIASNVGSPGARLYETHCAACHGDSGEGVAGAYPALAGNRAVTMKTTANLVHVVLRGGFAPATAGNPRPFGMPPFATLLSDADVAELLSYVRSAWGNNAPTVSTLEVARYRGAAAR